MVLLLFHFGNWLLVFWKKLLSGKRKVAHSPFSLQYFDGQKQKSVFFIHVFEQKQIFFNVSHARCIMMKK